MLICLRNRMLRDHQSFFLFTQGKLGELLVSLNYQPSVGVISIGIIKARSLKAKDINGLSGEIRLTAICLIKLYFYHIKL